MQEKIEEEEFIQDPAQKQRSLLKEKVLEGIDLRIT
jgi:hypothetical protein